MQALKRQNRLLASDNEVLTHKIASDVTRTTHAEKASKRREAAHASALADLQSDITVKDAEVRCPELALTESDVAPCNTPSQNAIACAKHHASQLVLACVQIRRLSTEFRREQRKAQQATQVSRAAAASVKQIARALSSAEAQAEALRMELAQVDAEAAAGAKAALAAAGVEQAPSTSPDAKVAVVLCVVQNPAWAGAGEVRGCEGNRTWRYSYCLCAHATHDAVTLTVG